MYAHREDVYINNKKKITFYLLFYKCNMQG